MSKIGDRAERTPRYIVTYESMPIEADSPEEAIEHHTANERGGGTWSAVEVTEGDDLAVIRDMPDPRDDALDRIAEAFGKYGDPGPEGTFDVLFETVVDVLCRTGREV